MEAAKNLVGVALSGRASALAVNELPSSLAPEAAQVINKLFAELQGIFPAWRQAWPDAAALDEAKRSWVKAFIAERINTLEQIQFGLRRCRESGSDFAPSVGKFIRWCQPTAEMLGLPPVSKAYRCACEIAHPNAGHVGVHSAVYHAACETGFYELRTLPEAKSRPMFERAYSLTVQMILAGEPLREIPKALPAEVSVRTPEKGREGIAALREVLGGKRNA